MTRIDRLTLREIHLPLVEPFRTAGGTVVARRVLLLELEDASGATAWSECVAEASPSYSPDTVDTSWLALTRWVAPLACGIEVESPRALHARLDRTIRGHAMARAAVEMGAWALQAVRERRSLAALLAESTATARAGAPPSHVPAGIALGLYDSPPRLVERAVAAAAEGYRRIKLKVEPGRDVAHVEAVREALGADARISVDANCSYSLDSRAHVEALRALDALGLAWIEQPLAHDDLMQHAALQRRLETAICLDESIAGLSRVEDALALGSMRLVNLKPGRVGGFTAAIAIHDRCARAGMPVWCGGMLETGIGRAYNVALAALPNFTEPGDLSPSARYWARDVVTPAWTMAEGMIRVPREAPGIGVEVDVEYIREITVREETIRR